MVIDLLAGFPFGIGYCVNGRRHRCFVLEWGWRRLNSWLHVAVGSCARDRLCCRSCFCCISLAIVKRKSRYAVLLLAVIILVSDL